ncbi:hypothetical protein GL177_00005 [Vibrio toranzoniae]|uniref:hypothetical protein n=1 Tax=Vibrio toranzoniae TaxID=1194427 RepID=UPI001377A6A0|nr:hypothetical protein [Vibrio toranzoniae]NAZ51752.1 hypothetical protein [Vibrio toranzoniae]
MLDFLDKLADYLVSVMITFAIMFFFLFEPTISFIKKSAAVRDQVVELQEENLQLKERYLKLEKGIEELEIPENLNLALSIQTLQGLVKQNAISIKDNSALINDIDGLLVSDKEKLKSLYEVNANYKQLAATVQKLESNVEKNEDRIFSAITIREAILLAILLVIAPFSIKLYVSKKK